MKRLGLERARRNKGMTQFQVASLSGINRSFYGLIEAGVRTPSLPVATRIAAALEMDIEEAFPECIFFGNRCYVTKHIRDSA